MTVTMTMGRMVGIGHDEPAPLLLGRIGACFVLFDCEINESPQENGLGARHDVKMPCAIPRGLFPLGRNQESSNDCVSDINGAYTRNLQWARAYEGLLKTSFSELGKEPYEKDPRTE